MEITNDIKYVGVNDHEVDLFEGQDSYGAKENGKLTVSENVADLGGLSAALEAAKQDPD